MTPAKTMNHVGITVTNIDEAAQWYTKIFGCTILMHPTLIEDDGSYFAEIVADIFGEKFQSIKKSLA